MLLYCLPEFSMVSNKTDIDLIIFISGKIFVCLEIIMTFFFIIGVGKFHQKHISVYGYFSLFSVCH